jgi:adenylate cyclase
MGVPQSTTELATEGKPSITVLSFNNMSGDAEQAFFLDGITEDIITDLSKVSGLYVVARTTVSFIRDREGARLSQGVRRQVYPGRQRTEGRLARAMTPVG